MACRLDNWQGEVIADPAEVHAWKFAEVPDIQADMERHPDEYTAWFRAEVHAIAAKGAGEALTRSSRLQMMHAIPVSLT